MKRKVLSIILIVLLNITIISCGREPGTSESGKIKGNINSKGEKIYHMPDGAYYDKTDAEQWFNTEAEAKEAGFRKSKR